MVRFEVGISPESLKPVQYQWRRHRLSYVTNVAFIFVEPGDPASGFWRTNRQGVFSVTVLPGETNATYEIADVQLEHSDYYSVLVSNALGASASKESLLSVDGAVAFRATNSYWSAIHCANNLKQIVLLGRIWANERGEVLPSDLAMMTNTLGLPLFGWPTLLYCRADTERAVPADWTGVDFVNTSYEILPVTQSVDEVPSSIFCRCRVHGFRARADGMVEHQPQFNSIRPGLNGRTELAFEVFGRQTTVLEASTDLVNWEGLGAFTVHGEFSLSESKKFFQRYYRLRAE
jgi:hypothetical protein